MTDRVITKDELLKIGYLKAYVDTFAGLTVEEALEYTKFNHQMIDKMNQIRFDGIDSGRITVMRTQNALYEGIEIATLKFFKE